MTERYSEMLQQAYFFVSGIENASSLLSKSEPATKVMMQTRIV